VQCGEKSLVHTGTTGGCSFRGRFRRLYNLTIDLTQLCGAHPQEMVTLLQSWDVSLVAQTGLQFDRRSAQGKLIASLMAALAEFERDLLRERVRSGIAAARKRGVVFGRRPGQRVKADRFAPKVLKLVGEGQSYREISHRLGLSKNTILDIVNRDRAA
jgi:DNA invertase Pin-like site-specific DNA recombinase